METCVICGEPIPEGRMVCPKCEKEGRKTDEPKKINAWRRPLGEKNACYF